jgi:CubicO group peptidase (beta-lactamase class C family)
MSRKKYLFPVLLVGTVLALINRLFVRAYVQPASTKSASRSTSYDAIDTYIEGQMRRLNIPGVSLAIVEADRTVHLRGFGRARPGGEAPSPQTPFFIGSITKSFTALAVMQLVDAGKVELDAPVQRYLPWFRVADPQASAQMTVRHLLNQTSSLPVLPSEAALADFDDRPDATERQVRALSTLKLTRPVSAKFEYSNTNYNILGLVVEAVSGQSYADYIQEHVFNPLKMCHSYASKAIAQQNGLAVGHRYWFGHPFPAPNLSIPLGSLPSGQLISCAEDMAHYLGMERDGDFDRTLRHGLGKSEYRCIEHHLTQWHSSRFWRLHGPCAGAEERTRPALQCQSWHDEDYPGRGWDGGGTASRWRATHANHIWRTPLGDARPAAHPDAPDYKRHRHAAADPPLEGRPRATAKPEAPVGAAYPSFIVP